MWVAGPYTSYGMQRAVAWARKATHNGTYAQRQIGHGTISFRKTQRRVGHGVQRRRRYTKQPSTG